MNPQQAYQQVMIFLARVFPQLYFLSKQFRVVYVDEEVPQTPIMTDGRNIILTRTWISRDLPFRVVSFMHELYHILLKHPIRLYKLIDMGEDPQIVILAGDAKTNYCVKQALILRKVQDLHLYEEYIYTFGISDEVLEKASVEEIVEMLKEQLEQTMSLPTPTFGNDVQKPESGDSGGSGDEQKSGESENGQNSSEGGGDDEKEKEGDGSGGGGNSQEDKEKGEDKKDLGGVTVLNEGNAKIINAKTLNDLESALNGAIRRSLISAKFAGCTLTSIEERILTELTKPKVKWTTIFRNSIISYIRELMITTYRFRNRRIPHLPGHQPVSKPNVWVFVDVSGSISYKEFNQFMSEVYHISKEVSDVKVITWDTEVTGEYDLKDRKAISKIRFRGGGGTTFSPIIGQYLKKIMPSDVVIVLTDGYWYDANDSEKILKKINAYKILVTTVRFVGGFDKEIKIEV